MIHHIDHIVYATPNLQKEIEELEELLGVKATPGGKHPKWRTKNALISLGPEVYLEIIGPDPEMTSKPDIFRLGKIEESKVVTWAMKCNKLEEMVRLSAQQGMTLGNLRSGRRDRPNGYQLNWRLTDPQVVIADGVVPFLIDWGATENPAVTAAKGCQLMDLNISHPDPELVKSRLNILGINTSVASASVPQLKATIQSPRGEVQLS